MSERLFQSPETSRGQLSIRDVEREELRQECVNFAQVAESAGDVRGAAAWRRYASALRLGGEPTLERVRELVAAEWSCSE